MNVLLTYCSLALIIAAFFIGFLEWLRKAKRLDERIAFLGEFRNLFVGWLNSRCQDNVTYSEILRKSPAAQKKLGHWGIVDYRPPFATYIIRKWQIILNAIPTIKQHLNTGGDSSQYHAEMVEEALMRGLGAYEDERNDLQGEIWNPFRHILAGLASLLSFPFYILAELGLITSKAYFYLKSSVIVRAIGFLLFCMGSISALVGLVTGWESFWSISQSFLRS